MPKADDPMLPTPLLLVACDSISHDIVTGKTHLHGLLGALLVPEIPALLSFAVYGTFTGVRKNLTINIQVVDAEDNELVRTKDIAYPMPSQVLAEGIVVEYLQLEFPKYGHYFVRLLVDGMYIMERRLVIVEPLSPQEMEEL